MKNCIAKPANGKSPESSHSTADAPVIMGDVGGGGDGEGGGGGGTSAMVSGDTKSTTIETPVTFTNTAVALLGLLNALAIVDSTKAAVAAYVSMLTSTRTLPGNTSNSTADGSTPARAATALCIWACTLGVNEEMSPLSSRANPTLLIAGGEGGGDGGVEGGGDEGGGDGGVEGGGGEGGRGECGGEALGGECGGGRGGGGGACGAPAGTDGGGGEGEGGGGDGVEGEGGGGDGGCGAGGGGNGGRCGGGGGGE